MVIHLNIFDPSGYPVPPVTSERLAPFIANKLELIGIPESEYIDKSFFSEGIVNYDCMG